MTESTTNTRDTLPVATAYWINGVIHGSALRQALRSLVNYQASIVAVRINVVPADESCVVTIQIQPPEKQELRQLGQRRCKKNRDYFEAELYGCRVVWAADFGVTGEECNEQSE